MIRIQRNRIEDKIIISGHSQNDVCASVSSIMYTTVNAILKYNENAINYIDNIYDDYVEIQILDKDNFVDLLIENMIDLYIDLSSQVEDKVCYEEIV